MGYIKSLLVFLTLVLVAAYYSVKVLFRWGDTSLNREFNLTFSKISLAITGLRIKILNQESIHSRRPAVCIGNHQTGMDFAVIGALCPTDTVIIGKKEIIYIPFLGWFLKGAGNILIDRSKTRKAHESLLNAIQRMKEKKLNLAIMPEGTRNRGDKNFLLPFKKGAFNVAIEAGFPIIPVVCSNLSKKAILETGEMSGGEAIISVLPPVETTGLTSQDSTRLAEQVRGLMQAELTRINQLVANGER